MSAEERRNNNGGCLTAAARLSASCAYSTSAWVPMQDHAHLSIDDFITR